VSESSLLVSVRCADEVTSAVLGGAKIIDVKEPLHGSLGMASLETLAACSAAVPERLLWTCAGGELLDRNGNGDSAARRMAVSLAGLKRLPYAVKFGLSRCCDIEWTEVFHDVAASLPVNVRAIPVAYADWQAAGSPDVPAVLNAANLYGWSTVLVDTFDKAESGSLLDLVSIKTLQDWVAQASRHGVDIVLAGRLSLEDVPAVSACEPMAVAVRSAVCIGGRNGRVDTRLVQMVASQCHDSSLNSRKKSIVGN
jgi:uncharacterized protein (UPF0264 family)